MADTRPPQQSMRINKKLRLHFNKQYVQVSKRDGLCHGIAGVGVDLLFAKNFFGKNQAIDKFNRIVAILENAASLDDLGKRIDVFLKKRNDQLQPFMKNYEAAASIETLQFFGMGDTISLQEAIANEKSDEKKVAIRNHFTQLVNQKTLEQENKLFSQDELDLLEIRPLFDAIELYFNAYQYPNLFPLGEAPNVQHIQKTFLLAQPTSLEDQERVIAVTTSGIYSEQDIFNFLLCIKQCVAKQNSETHFSLTLSSANHSITIGYHPDPENPEWFLIDINKLPIKRILSENELSQEVMQSFLYDKYNAEERNGNRICFCADLITHKNKSADFVEALNAQAEWLALHKVTAMKSTQIDAWDATWLLMTIKSNAIETAKEILEYFTDLNQCSEEDISSSRQYYQKIYPSALALAVQYHRSDMFELLLNHQSSDNGDFWYDYTKSLLPYLFEKKFTSGIDLLLSMFAAHDALNEIPITVYTHHCLLKAIKTAHRARKNADPLLEDQCLAIIQTLIKHDVHLLFSRDIIRQAQYGDIYLEQPLNILVRDEQYELLARILANSDITKKEQIDGEMISIQDYLESIGVPNKHLSALLQPASNPSTPTQLLSNIGLLSVHNKSSSMTEDTMIPKAEQKPIKPGNNS